MRGYSNVTECSQFLRHLYINTKDLGDFAGLEKGQSGRIFLASGKQTGAMLSFGRSFLQRPSSVVPGVMESIDAYDYALLLSPEMKAFDDCDYRLDQYRLLCGPNYSPTISFTAKGRVERGTELSIKERPLEAAVRQYEGFYIMEGRLDGELFYGYFWN